MDAEDDAEVGSSFLRSGNRSNEIKQRARRWWGRRTQIVQIQKSFGASRRPENAKKRVLSASACKQEGYRSWMDGAREVGRSQKRRGEEEGRSTEERERGMGGGVFIYLFFILSSTPAWWWWTRVQSSSAAINGPDAAAEHPGREGGRGASHPGAGSHLSWVEDTLRGHPPTVISNTHLVFSNAALCSRYFNTRQPRGKANYAKLV